MPRDVFRSLDRPVSASSAIKLLGGFTVVLAIAGVTLFHLDVLSDPYDPDAEAKAEEQNYARQMAASATRRRCRHDLQCWASKHELAAATACKRKAEKAAVGAVRWNTTFGHIVLSGADWLNEDDGTIRYIGDDALLQNPMGAWLNGIYQCDYDPRDGSVIAQVRAGRLK